MMVIISKQPNCKYCGKIMKEWYPFINDKDQAHPECEGKAMAEISLQKVMIKIFQEGFYGGR